MKLSVGKKTVAWVKIGLPVGAYAGFFFLIEVQSYIALALLSVSFILLGYVLPELQYLREKPRRLAISYVILIWLGNFHVGGTIITLGGEYTNWGVIGLSNFILSITLSILIYFLILKKVKPVLVKPVLVKPVLREVKQHQEKHLDTKSTFSNDTSMHDLKGVTTNLEVVFFLLALSNILAIMAIFLKQYVSLAFVIPVVIAAAILPLSKYLREESGRLSFAYIALLNGSYLMILPAATVGFAFHYGVSNLVPLLVYIPLSLLIVSFPIYFLNRVNVNLTVKGILRKMCYERKSRVNAFKQLGETEAKKYKRGLYLAVFISLPILNTIAVLAEFIIGVNDGEGLYLSIYSHFVYLVLAAFILKRFLPTVRLYPLIPYYCLLLLLSILVFSNAEGAAQGSERIRMLYIMSLYCILVGFASITYKIHRSITESKFVWGDAAVGVKN